ncbi:LacI family DNA-binding transcriptional regulator [Anaerolentibacter hominis]|uniref:LacI family DNA-binding transcriptional regulator n=1 Tax=Anaerolentibacter hominis TaxID=3079009 RepID=UPI0031B805ED
MTIKDIAARAGVSKSTVSRVINNAGYVNAQTRQKVEAVIRELNFLPSASARSLSRQETSAVGVLIPEIDNSFFGEALRGILEIIDENDLTLICCDTDNNAAREEKALRMLKGQRVRGIILTPAVDYPDPEEAGKVQRLIEDLNVPVVQMDREFAGAGWDGVFYENKASAYAATEILIEEGCRKIGIITGDLKLKIARERFLGYKAALADHGIPMEEDFIYQGDFTIETAYRLTRDMLSADRLPEGMLTCNNRTSLGFIKGLRERNMRPGREIAAIGIDHIPVLDVIGYDYSYVTRDTVEMGREAMRLLLGRIEEPDRPARTVMMPYKLALKGSERKR